MVDIQQENSAPNAKKKMTKPKAKKGGKRDAESPLKAPAIKRQRLEESVPTPLAAAPVAVAEESKSKQTTNKQKIHINPSKRQVTKLDAVNKPATEGGKNKPATEGGKKKPATEGGKKKPPGWKNRGKKKKAADRTEVNPARLPSAKGGDASSNWKNLLTDMKKEDPTIGTKKRETVTPAPRKNTKPVEETKKKPDIWFDDVDEMLLDPEDRAALRGSDDAEDKPSAAAAAAVGSGLVKEKSFKGLTKIVGMDCEMVGVGLNGEDSILARASLVNHFGHCIYDKYVKATEKVTDYRTAVSGIRPEDIENAEDFKTVQKEIYDILDGRVLVGHSINHDLKVLFLNHPKAMIRDTANYKPFKNAFGGRTPSLKRLTEQMIGVKVQEGEHSSVQDAQAAMRVYTMFRKEWEKSLLERKAARRGGKDKAGKSKGQPAPVAVNVAPVAAPTTKPAATSRKEEPKRKNPVYQDSDSD